MNSEASSQTEDRVLDVAPEDSQSQRKTLRNVLLWLLFIVALKLVAPFVPIESRGMALFFSAFFTVAYTVGIIGFAARATQLRLSNAARVALLLGFLVLWFVLDNFVATPFNATFARNFHHNSSAIFTHQFLNTSVDLTLLCAAVCGGSLVAQMISAPNVLGPLCAIFALIDVWFVLFGGIAAQIAANAPKYAEKVTASAPAVGAATNSAAQFVIHPVGIGAADYLFIGLVFAVMHRHAMNWRGAAKLMTVLIAVALVAVTVGIGMLPGLLFIGLGTAIPNLKFFKFSREESFALLYAGLFVVVLTIGLYFATPFIIERMKTVK